MEVFDGIVNFFQSDNLELFIRLSFQVVLLTSSAFFSGSETALFSLNRMDLQKLRNSRHRHSDKLHEMLDEPRKLIVSILCGNELVNIASSANMAAILISTVGEDEATMFNIIIMVPMLLLFGEVTPKTIAVTSPIRWCTGLSAPLLPRWINMIGPLREVVRYAAERITTLIVGKAEKQSNILDPDEFQTLVEYSEASGVIDPTERVLIDNMMDAARTDVVSIMTPRTRGQFIYGDMPMSDILEEFKRLQHSRVPVIRRFKDNVIGFLHSEDMVRLVQKKIDLSQVSLEDVLRPAQFVPPTKKVDEMFDFFQENNTRAVMILGEDGGIIGMVTMSDVLKFTFGGVTDNRDQESLYERMSGDKVTVPGDMRLMDFNNMTNLAIMDDRMTTIAGYVFRLLGRLPKEGEAIIHSGVSFTVLEMDKLRIKTLRVQLVKDEDAEVVVSSSKASTQDEKKIAEENSAPSDKEEPAKTDKEG